MKKKLGRYELVEPLGQGGMGEVWLARLSGAGGFEKPAIVKTVLPSLAKDEQFVQRFHHEGKVLVHLSHSNIAQVYDLDESEGVLFMALEYVAGVDVSRLVTQVAKQDELIPVPVALFIAWQAAEGLAYAHSKAAPDGSALAIIHRDVSPQNVMVGYEGEVKVIDFGISRSVARSHSTQAAMVMGKLGYMAPEQALAGTVDARADQYALAVLLWELLAGRHYVAAATTPEMMVAMAQPKPQPLGPLRSEVDAALDAAVQEALSPVPADRYPSTEEFARALLAQLTRLGQPTRKQVGDWVKLKCADAWETNQRLLSRLSTPQPVTIQTRGAVMTPNQAAAVLTTGAALKAMSPSRAPLVAGLVVAAVAMVATGGWLLRPQPAPKQEPPKSTEPPPEPAMVPVLPVELVEGAVGDGGTVAQAGPLIEVKKTAALFADGEKTFARAGAEDGVRVGVELLVVGHPPRDGKRPLLGAATVLEVFPKMARLSLDDAARHAPGEKLVALDAPKAAAPKQPVAGAKAALNASLALVELPRRAVRLQNNSRTTFSRCTIFIPGQRQVSFPSLPGGMSREIVLEQFTPSPSAPVLDNAVRMDCAQGSITLPVQ